MSGYRYTASGISSPFCVNIILIIVSMAPELRANTTMTSHNTTFRHTTLFPTRITTMTTAATHLNSSNGTPYPNSSQGPPPSAINGGDFKTTSTHTLPAMPTNVSMANTTTSPLPRQSTSPTPSAVPTSITKNKMNLAIIIGPVAAILLLLLIIIISVIIVCCRKKKKEEDPEAIPDENENATVPETTLIPVNELQQFMKSSDKEVKIFGQFEGIPKISPSSALMKTAKRNPFKDMYANIAPYDHNCVKLQPVEGQLKSTYINASYIDGYDRPKVFIAATGPRDTSVVDFWRMIWEQSVHTIVMLTLVKEKSKKKCEQYWPDIVGDSTQFGDFLIKFEKEKQNLDFVVRYLSVKKQNEIERTVSQYHFMTWNDQGVPDETFGVINLRCQLQKQLQFAQSPILTHCSAGVGRTGTLIAINNLLDQASSEGAVDVPICVTKLRGQRMKMVQTADQYEFVYKAVADGVLLGNTCIPFSQFLLTYQTFIEPLADGSTVLQNQFNLLSKIGATRKPIQSPGLHLTIKRIPDAISTRISTYFHGGALRESSANTISQLEVVSVKSFSMCPTYLATSTPTRDNIASFWQTVQSNGCRSIIMLSSLQDTEVSDQYCPDEEGENFAAPPFFADCNSKTSVGNHVFRKLTLTNRGSKDITHHCVSCSMTSLQNKDIVELFCSIYEETIVKQRDSQRKPVLIHCKDGIEWTGLYCAFSCLLDQMNSDKEINLFQAVRLIKTAQRQFISMAQYNQLVEMLYIYVRDNI